MECSRDGDVYLKGTGVKGLYVESNYLDREMMFTPRDRSHFLYEGAIMKVYDLRQAFDQMCFWVTHQNRNQEEGRALMNDQVGAVGPRQLPRPLQKFVSQMRSLCVVRCIYNVSWQDMKKPDFHKAPSAVEFYVNR